MDLQLLRGLYKDIARDISVGLTEPPARQGLADPPFLPYEVSHISSLRILLRNPPPVRSDTTIWWGGWLNINRVKSYL